MNVCIVSVVSWRSTHRWRRPLPRRVTVASLLVIATSIGAQAQASGALEEVTVWAQKREAPAQSVPIAISTLDAEQLSMGGIEDIDGLARRLSVLDVQRNAGITTTSLRIRRVGNIGNIPTFEPAVGLFVDGTFRSRPFLSSSHLLGVDHVEVLRGPQSTLYGKNVGGGLVAIYTRKPTEHFSGDIEMDYGRIDSARSTSLRRAKLAAGGPLAADFRGGIAARFAQHDHMLLNALPGPEGDNEHEVAVNGQLFWSPDDAFEMRLIGRYIRERDDQGESDVFLAPGAPSTTVSQILQQLGLTAGCSDNIPRNRTVCSVDTNKLELESRDVTLLGTYRLSNGWTVGSTTSWDSYDVLRIEEDAIQLFAPMLFYRDAEEGSSVQEELRLASADSGTVTWLAGAFFYRNDYARGDNGRVPMFGANGALALNPIWPVLLGGLPLAVPGQLGIHDSSLDTRYLSVFGQLSWRINAKFEVIAGLRWQDERKTAVIDNSVSVPGLSLISAILTPQVTLAGLPVNGRLSRRTRSVPWSITPQYRFSDKAMAYFTVEHGSKSGGFNTGFGDAPLAAREFADEAIRHYELGAKASLTERLRLAAAAFHTQYENYQDAAFVSAQFSVGNAEQVDLKGIEVDGSALLSQRWMMDFSVSFAELSYDKYTSGLCHPGRLPDGRLPNSCVLSGERPIAAPPWATHVGLEYRLPTTWGEATGRLDWSWTDKFNTSFSADPRLVQRAHSDVGVRVGLSFGQSCELVVWGENLLNQNVSYFDSLLNLFNDESYQSYLAMPRSYGVTLRIRL